MKSRNQQRNKKCSHGFSLIELLIAMAVTLILLAGALTIFVKSLDTNDITMLRAEMQANARAAANSITQDLNLTGIGMPWGGLGLPTSGATPETFATAYLSPNQFVNNKLYGITPANGAGPKIGGITMDGITMVYQDPVLSDTTNATWNWTTNHPVSITATGTNSVAITFPTANNPTATPPVFAMVPAVNDPSYGLQVGDVLLLNGTGGKQAAGVITQLTGGNVATLATGDIFNINQFTTTLKNNLPALGDTTQNPTAYNAADFTVMRIYIITYFLQPLDAAGNLLPVASKNGAPDYRLMRQVNAQAPTVAAEHVDYLQFTYDLSDPTCVAAPSIGGLPDAVNPGACFGSPPPVPYTAYDQIRNVHLTLAARTAKTDKHGQYYHETVTTSISPRMLSYDQTYPNNVKPGP